MSTAWLPRGYAKGAIVRHAGWEWRATQPATASMAPTLRSLVWSRVPGSRVVRLAETPRPTTSQRSVGYVTRDMARQG